MITIKNTDINLKDTITCGQIFRYDEELDNSYTVILSDRVVNIKQEGNNLIVISNDENDSDKLACDVSPENSTVSSFPILTVPAEGSSILMPGPATKFVADV